MPARQIHSLDLDAPRPPVRRGHLDLGGGSITGERVAVNNQFIEVNGRPWIPVVGEIHFSRYPAEYWDEAIRKMKAGGINVIATYVFWSIHERTEGKFDWTGDRNLRRFLERCAANDMRAIVRMGPFCHGEVRNGGIPDWIYGRPVEIRSNDPGYLFYADRLYGEIARQLRGQLFKEGGPVIGVQLENEYQHSAAPWEWTHPGAPRELTVAGRDVDVTHIQITAGGPENKFADEGRDHMATLKRLARAHGIDVPLYTATGWGNAAIVPDGSIPVTAGYAYPFWAPTEPSDFYLFKDIRLNPDYPPVSYEPDRYPSIPAELGAGISLTYGRRPTVPPESLAPLIVRTVGSGANGIGYYMYHGGSNPVIDGQFFNEQSGGLPRINYDYQAPIGEFGEMRAHHRELKLLHLLLASWGDRLAPMAPLLPATNAAITPDNVETLRWAVRTDGRSGFVFLHNFQDHIENHDLTGLRLELRREAGEAAITFPHEGAFTLRRNASGILPFNLDLDGLTLRTATVQPLTMLRRGNETHHVFMTVEGMEPELVFAGGPPLVSEEHCSAARRDGVTVVTGDAEQSFRFRAGDRHFLVIPRALALTLVHTDASRLVFADADGFPGPAGLELRTIGRSSIDLKVYPATEELRTSWGVLEPQPAAAGGMAAWRLQFEPTEAPVTVRRVGARRLVVSVADATLRSDDIWLRVPYIGDRVAAFIGGELVADHFYFGQPWDLGLRKFAGRLDGEDLVFVFHPLSPTASYLLDLPEGVQAELKERASPLLRIDDPVAQPEYRARLTFRP